jgi:hypothetical protein
MNKKPETTLLNIITDLTAEGGPISCDFRRKDLRKAAEDLISDLDTEHNWRPYYETELQPLFAALKRLGAPDELDTELHHQIEWLVERLEKTEEQRNRAREELTFSCQYPNCRDGTCQMLSRYRSCRTLIALADDPPEKP